MNVSKLLIAAAAAIAVASAPQISSTGWAQEHDHSHAGGQAHHHAAAPVDCKALAAPPWTGLPERDREKVRALEAAVSNLSTTEAARAAGYRPVLGNIPTMGVHWVRPGSSRTGVTITEPDHLLFAPIDGEDRLVGAAYAFADAPNTDVPVPFESELAHWHDHPQFAGPGQTLHMLHVWFVPSSDGPFAGNNFWLPYHGAGVQPPSACWMADEEVARKIQTVAMVLALGQLDVQPLLGRLQGAERELGEQLREVPQASVRASADDLDAAARAGDQEAWVAAADRFLAGRTVMERMAAERLIAALTHAQMSSAEREAGRP